MVTRCRFKTAQGNTLHNHNVTTTWLRRNAIFTQWWRHQSIHWRYVSPVEDTNWLPHLPLVPYIYASVNRVSIASDNGLSPVRRQAIIWTNAGILSIWSLATSFNEISTKIQHFHSRKCIWKYRLRNGGHFVQGDELLEINDQYMRRWTRLPWIQMNDYSTLSHYSELMLNYCRWDPEEHTSTDLFDRVLKKFKIHSRNECENVGCKMSILLRPQWTGCPGFFCFVLFFLFVCLFLCVCVHGAI